MTNRNDEDTGCSGLGRLLITIDITTEGRVTRWTVAQATDGAVVEDWRLRDALPPAATLYSAILREIGTKGD